MNGTLFDVDETWREEWQDMPEYIQENKMPIRQITVSFASKEDVKAFSSLLKQTITPDTISLWYPKKVYEKVGTYTDEP